MICIGRIARRQIKWSGRNHIRPAGTAEARAIAALVRRCESTLVSQPEQAAPFWQLMSEASHSEYLGSSRFAYALAEVDGEMAGFIAMRDGSHLLNLFVEPSKHRLGIGRALWQYSLDQVRNTTTFDHVTVNASRNAVCAYRALGFKEVGPLARQHGIEFIPMMYRLANR